jgi:hypothetical protein
MNKGANSNGQGHEENSPVEAGLGEPPQPSMEEVGKLREKNQRLQGQIVELEKKYQTFSSIYKDIDPDEVKSLRQRLEETERSAAEKDPAKLEDLFEKKFNKYRSEVETEKQRLGEELAKLQRANKTLAVTDKVMGEIGSLFNQDAVRWIKREVEESCDLDDDGSIVVKDESGDILYKGARPMTLKEYGEHLVEKYPSLAKASGVGGVKDFTPGQQRSGQRASNRVPQTFAELQSLPNAKEVLERLKKDDPAAVQKILRTISA